MLGFRFLFLAFCDLFIAVFTKIRKLGSYSSKDCPTKNVYLDSIFPYDLIITKEQFSNLQADPNNIPAWGEPYLTGVVLGFSKIKNNEEPEYIFVAHFNTAEFNRPVVRKYKTKEIVVLHSPLRKVILPKDTTSNYDKIINDLSKTEKNDIIH